MKWLTRILIGLGVVVALLVAVVLLAPDEPQVKTHEMEMTFGSHTVAVKALYVNQLQQTTGDEGVALVVDGREHHITASGDQLSVDGKTRVLEPGQDAEIFFNETGGIDVQVLESDGDSSGAASD
jgi:hypothetical protein